MNEWILLLVVFGVGASLTRLVTSDKLLAPLRDRIEERWVWRSIEVLRDGEAGTLVPGRSDYANPEHVHNMRSEVYRRAFAGERRWRKLAWKLDWIDAYKAFVTCPWCTGFWVFLAVALFAWLVVLDVPSTVWGGPWWLMVPAVALTARWVYGLIATRLDN